MLIVTDNNFQATLENNSRPVVMVFSKAGCSPCLDVKAEMSLMERQYGDNILVCVADLQRAKKSATRHKVRDTPVVIMFSKGSEVHRYRGGSVTSGMVKRWVDKLLVESRD